jgi:hypothetical protein
MAKDADQWWYSLVGVSPRPESGELVNVGLILGNGRPAQMVYVPGLPRLSGLVDQAEAALFSEMMESIAERVEGGTDLSTLRASVGPQLRIAPERRLYEAGSGDVITLLRDRYLVTSGIPESREENRALVKQSEQALDKVVGKVIRFGLEVVDKNVTYDRLYEKRPAWAANVRIPRLARAYRSARRDLLVDGVIVEPERTEDAIKAATTRISRAFWYYSRLRGDIEKLEGRQVQTVGLLLDGKYKKVPEVAEARAYIKHIWETEQALVLETDHPGAQDALKERLRWAALEVS